MATAFQVTGHNEDAKFKLTIHRGEGMALIAMNWKGRPPSDLVGFGIEFREPDGDRFFPIPNRIGFADANGGAVRRQLSSLLSPIQKFRWIHFPRNADKPGAFLYRVTPVFMNAADELSYGEPQTASIVLRAETYPGKLNVAFTRGFVSSQAFVDRYEADGPISKLLPKSAKAGLKFKPTHPKAKEALKWMGFEAREAILSVLDAALADKKAQVRVVAYDLSEPDVVGRLAKLGKRLKIIVDDSADHGESGSGENQAATILAKSAGKANVKRQHMGNLQHNKLIVVDGPKHRLAVFGSTNFSWRGFFVQANNAVIVQGAKAIAIAQQAFDNYWNNGTPATFGATASAVWQPLGVAGVDAEIAFSPHTAEKALLQDIADDVAKAHACIFYSLAFLHQTRGAIRTAITQAFKKPNLFIYGISDRKLGGIDLQKADAKVKPVFPAELGKDVPEPFKTEPTGGSGIRMHHKFIVIDFGKPTARVYLGSYNFSGPADTDNGENLLVIRDPRIVTSYTVEAVRLFDHYQFRVAEKVARGKRKPLTLVKPPRTKKEQPWWFDYYAGGRKEQDRLLFS